MACLIFILLLNIDHYILFAVKICILLLILHGLNYKHARVPHFSAILRYCIYGESYILYTEIQLVYALNTLKNESNYRYKHSVVEVILLIAAPLLVGFLCLGRILIFSTLCPYIFAIIRAGCFTLTVFLMSRCSQGSS